MSFVLTAQDLELSYGPTRALRGLSLEVRAGETLGLLGPNGAGKSTFVGVACGILRPSKGSVRLNGGCPLDPEVRRQLGVAPQEPAIYPRLTTAENLAFFASLYGLRVRETKEAVTRGLAFADLEDKAHVAAATLSGGMLRRLNLAIAVLHRPRLLLLDEPTAGVDPQSRAHLHARLAELRASGTTMVYTSHLLDEVERIADRVAIVDHGRVLVIDDVASIVRRLAPKYRISVDSADTQRKYTVVDIQRELARLAQLPDLARVSVEPMSLEDIYLEFTGTQLRD